MNTPTTAAPAMSTTGELVRSVLQATATQEAAKQRVTILRERLKKRLATELAADGADGVTKKMTGLGDVRIDPVAPGWQPKVVAAEAFAHHLAQVGAPGARGVLVVAGADVTAAVMALESAGIPADVSHTLTSDADAYLEGVVVDVDEDPNTGAPRNVTARHHDKETGEVVDVPGVWVEKQVPRMVIRLDKDLKKDTVAQVAAELGDDNDA